MTCPKCGCKVHYKYDTGHDPAERCASCGKVFYSEEAADDEDEREVKDDQPGTWVNLTGELAEFVPVGERCSAIVHADMLSRAYDEPPPADHIAAQGWGVWLIELTDLLSRLAHQPGEIGQRAEGLGQSLPKLQTALGVPGSAKTSDGGM